MKMSMRLLLALLGVGLASVQPISFTKRGQPTVKPTAAVESEVRAELPVEGAGELVAPEVVAGETAQEAFVRYVNFAKSHNPVKIGHALNDEKNPVFFPGDRSTAVDYGALDEALAFIPQQAGPDITENLVHGLPKGELQNQLEKEVSNNGAGWLNTLNAYDLNKSIRDAYAIKNSWYGYQSTSAWNPLHWAGWVIGDRYSDANFDAVAQGDVAAIFKRVILEKASGTRLARELKASSRAKGESSRSETTTPSVSTEVIETAPAVYEETTSLEVPEPRTEAEPMIGSHVATEEEVAAELQTEQAPEVPARDEEAGAGLEEAELLMPEYQ